MATSGRARAARELRRTAQFSKFRLVQLNLIPLVDTFVSIVFFALTTATVGELIPVMTGVSLPETKVGAPTLQENTIGVGSNPSQITFNGHPLMTVQQAASQPSNDAKQPLLIPSLFAQLKTAADSIRREKHLSQDQSVDSPLAIQGDKTMRFDLLSRIMQTARLAGFRTLTLQVKRAEETGGATSSTTT
jgi:biopolymer transport protein ExbD